MKILVICVGNLNRSPLAEAVLNKEGLEVKSAGFRKSGEKASKKTRDWAFARGYYLGLHTSTKVTKELVDWATVILCMNEKHVVDLENMFPGAEDKCDLLGKYDGGSLSIPDPGFLKSTDPRFDDALNRIVKCCKLFARSNHDNIIKRD